MEEADSFPPNIRAKKPSTTTITMFATTYRTIGSPPFRVEFL